MFTGQGQALGALRGLGGGWLRGERRTPGPALAPTQVTVRDANGAEVAEGALGELWIRGRSRMKGYYNDGAATAAAFQDDWLRAGEPDRVDQI
jgi:long-subunit acyl-CoA synthetase (AMP-forming)